MSDSTPPAATPEPPAPLIPEPSPAGPDADKAKDKVKRSPLAPNNFARLVLALTGTVWFGVAISAFTNPVDMAAGLDFAIDQTKLGRYEFRAMYGGLSMALAMLHFVGGSRVRWIPMTLVMSLATLAGLALGRLVSISVDGLPGGMGIPLLMVELLGITLTVWAMWRLRGSTRTP